MRLFNSLDSIAALEDVLDQERAAILGSRFDVLTRIVAEKERLIKLPVPVLSPTRIAALRRKADRNQAMLLAASRGVRSAARQLHESIDRQSSLQTYDSLGQRHTQLPGRRKLERRA